tara:strand:+ start:337 stop:1362 length:1026 start_codon:yes stop_codon:yes gene_type:complete
MTKHNVIALDLAKLVIQIAKVSKHGELLFNKAQSPDKVREILANTAPSVVAFEGCGSAHYWGRLAQQYGHTACMMSPRKVKPYIGGQKNDANDAIGIAVAARQLHMTFSPIKTLEQQTIQSINTSRRFLDKTLTALNNHIRGILYEYGFTIPKGAKGLRVKITEWLGQENVALPDVIKTLIKSMWLQYTQTQMQLKEVNQQLEGLTQALEPCQRLQAIEGIGPKSACLLYAAIGNGQGFKNGRDAAVYAGVTPRQHSSGGKTVLLGITKQGDTTLRSTLFQGALSVIVRLKSDPVTEKQQWLLQLVKRVGTKRACIALVNKNIRTAWAMLKHNSEYQPVYL